MAFGAIKKFPNDTRPRVGIGVNIPFSDGGVFTPNYQTKDAIKNNIINFFLTNPGERPDNPSFGGGLRRFVFEQLSDENVDLIYHIGMVLKQIGRSEQAKSMFELANQQMPGNEHIESAVAHLAL